jgi:hypothetical protein
VYVIDEIDGMQKIIVKIAANKVLYYCPVDGVVEAAVLLVAMVVMTDLGKSM